MTCCVEELCRKDVINVDDGSRIGYVCDVEVEMSSGQITALKVDRGDRAFSLKRKESLKIFWTDIVVIGSETILVKNVSCPDEQRRDNKKVFDIFLK